MALETENGLISTLTGLQTKEFIKSIHFNGEKIVDIVDWPHESQGIKPSGETDNHEFKTYNAVVNAFYYHGLVLMEKMAKAINNEADADFLKKAQRLKGIFNDHFSTARKVFILMALDQAIHPYNQICFPLHLGSFRKKTKEQ